MKRCLPTPHYTKTTFMQAGYCWNYFPLSIAFHEEKFTALVVRRRLWRLQNQAGKAAGLEFKCLNNPYTTPWYDTPTSRAFCVIGKKRPCYSRQMVYCAVCSIGFAVLRSPVRAAAGHTSCACRYSCKASQQFSSATGRKGGAQFHQFSRKRNHASWSMGKGKSG